MRSSLCLLPLVILLTVACSSDPGVSASSEPTHQSTQMQGDPSFSLRADERERLRAMQFDPDALEQLLRRFPASERASTLRSFLGESDDGSPAGTGHEGALPDVSVLQSTSDPSMQELLDQAWAPRWHRYSLEKLESIKEDLPGLKSAIREARKQGGTDR